MYLLLKLFSGINIEEIKAEYRRANQLNGKYLVFKTLRKTLWISVLKREHTYVFECKLRINKIIIFKHWHTAIFSYFSQCAVIQLFHHEVGLRHQKLPKNDGFSFSLKFRIFNSDNEESGVRAILT